MALPNRRGSSAEYGRRWATPISVPIEVPVALAQAAAFSTRKAFFRHRRLARASAESCTKSAGSDGRTAGMRALYVCVMLRRSRPAV